VVPESDGLRRKGYMKRTLYDPRWLKRFLAEHCRRGVQGAANKAAIGRLRIEVESWMYPGARQPVLKVHICDSRGSLATVEYDGMNATPLSASLANAPLFKTDEDHLTASVQALLRAHDLIDEFDIVKVA
jgi:hypothetical protein